MKLKPPELEPMIVSGLCCKDQYDCGWDHWHIYVDDQHVISVDTGKIVWCDRCEDYEDAGRTDCCDHIYPNCYLTIHPDGTTECYLCLNHYKEA